MEKQIKKKDKYRLDHNKELRKIHKEILRDTLKRIIDENKSFNIKTKIEQDQLYLNWCKIVGKEISLYTSVSVSKTGILTITAKNSIIIQELKLRESEIIFQFKQSKPIFIFKKIIYKVEP